MSHKLDRAIIIDNYLLSHNEIPTALPARPLPADTSHLIFLFNGNLIGPVIDSYQ
jgi:hypothetical protein